MNYRSFYFRTITSFCIMSACSLYTMEESLDDKLFSAIIAGQAARVVELLDQGANINAHSEDEVPRGSTPLMVAITEKQKNIIPLLLGRKDLDINAKSTEGLTALMTAAYMGDDKTIDLIRQRGVDANAKTAIGRTALMIVADKGSSAIIKLLLQIPGIDIDAIDKDGDTALIAATKRGYNPSVNALLNAGADATIQNDEGLSAIDIAVANRASNKHPLQSATFKRLAHETTAQSQQKALERIELEKILPQEIPQTIGGLIGQYHYQTPQEELKERLAKKSENEEVPSKKKKLKKKGRRASWSGQGGVAAGK